MNACNGFRRQDGLVNWVDDIAAPANPLLCLLQFGGGQAFRWQHGCAIGFGHTDHDVSAVQILKIIGKCTDCANDLCAGSLFIPGSLELNPRRFHALEVQQMVKIDGKNG